MKLTSRFIVGTLLLVGVVVWCTYAATGRTEEKKDTGYGTGKGEKAYTAKQVKLTVKNNSGKSVRFVTWRVWSSDAFVNFDLEDGEQGTYKYLAAEWRIVGVWELPGDSSDTPISHKEWGTSYKFNKNTTITINQDTLDIQ